ncbi:MAG TPA: CaiB/BaiF CoA-transferase family protein [Baekduia sp.]|nr:CaiB/BaiF CoA-transferase family protein [Baekduia sp.]
MTAADLPFEGLKVLDLSRLLPGGFCSLLLADFGADVVKVEDTGMGDYIRWSPPAFEGAAETANGSLFLSLNRGKRSIRVDLKTDEGRDVLLRLVRDADVLLESFRPGVLDRLGVGWERLRQENPRLVYCAITGYGLTGPNVQRSGHDLNYLGLNGILALTGEEDGPPVQAGAQIADLGGGALMAAFGILAALRERDRSGEGQLVDVSMFDGAMSWLAMVAARVFAAGEQPRRGHELLGGSLVCYRPYRCADGWVTCGALEPKFWAAFCRGVGREDLIGVQFERPGTPAHAEVEAIFAARTRDEWAAFATEHDCCVEPVLEVEEALDSELARAREMVVEFEQPGAGTVRGLGMPVKLSRTPGCVRRGGPELGEHTAEILREAGFDEARIAALLASGAVAGPPEPASGDEAPEAFLAR